MPVYLYIDCIGILVHITIDINTKYVYVFIDYWIKKGVNHGEKKYGSIQVWKYTGMEVYKYARTQELENAADGENGELRETADTTDFTDF